MTTATNPGASLISTQAAGVAARTEALGADSARPAHEHGWNVVLAASIAIEADFDLDAQSAADARELACDAAQLDAEARQWRLAAAHGVAPRLRIDSGERLIEVRARSATELAPGRWRVALDGRVTVRRATLVLATSAHEACSWAMLGERSGYWHHEGQPLLIEDASNLLSDVRAADATPIAN